MKPLTCEQTRETTQRENIADRAYAMLVCQEDVLVVCGAVPSFYLKQVLQTVLRDVDGVRQVDNQVAVMSMGV